MNTEGQRPQEYSNRQKQSLNNCHSVCFVGGFLLMLSVFLAFGYFLEEGKDLLSTSKYGFLNMDVLSLGGQGVLWLLMVVVLGGSALFWYSKRSDAFKDWLWNQIDTNIKWCFLIVWVMGFLTYCVGTYVGPATWPDWLGNIFSVVPMAIIHATEMFLGQNDISAIHGSQHENAYFMLFFNLSHFLAILCSMIFVLHQFGFFMAAQFRIWRHSRTETKGNLYIFWGLNEKSLLLAESIAYKIKADGEAEQKGIQVQNSESKSRIVFVRTYDDSDSHSSNVSFSRLFDMVKLKNQEIDKLRHLHSYVTTAFHQLSKAELTTGGNGKEQPTDILRDKLHLHSLARLISKARGKVHFFMLDEDAALNLNCTRRIACDQTLQDFSKDRKEAVCIYCHTRHNHISRVEEDIHSGTGIEVRILDSSSLAVNWLKSTNNGEYQPVRFVDINTSGNTGTVSSPFHSMLIGFGETGRDMFRFLYEFSAFLSPESNAAHTERSPFICNIVDENLDSILPQFLTDTPAMQNREWSHRLDCAGRHKITYHSVSHDSQEFNELLLSEHNLKSLNYVVISLGDDQEGVMLAVRILRQAAIYRGSLKHFRIFLRVFESERAMEIRHILNHYNEIYREEDCSGDCIITFGDPRELFCYDIIVKNKFRHEAVLHYYCYEQVRKCMQNHSPLPDFGKDGIDDEAADELWARRRKTLAADKRTHTSLRKLRRQESQDMANAYHRFTKNWIVELVAPAASADMQTALAENLAITEHLRWTAAHEMLGYRPNHSTPQCDESTKAHNCLVPWECLDEASEKTIATGYPQDYKEYDRYVVKTSELMNNIIL